MANNQKTSEPEQPAKPAASERRRNRLVAIVFQIEVAGTDLNGTTFKDPGVTTDISEDGCQFTFDRKLRPGEHLNLGLVNSDFARDKGNKAQPFEVVWAERGHAGWTIGVRKLPGENIWPINFPVERKSPN